MFSPGDFTYFKYLAKEATGGTEVSFDRRRLMIKTKFTTNQAYARQFTSVFFMGVFFVLAFIISLLTKAWLMLAISILLSTLLFWLIKNRLNSRNKDLHRPPGFVFDSDLNSFFILNKSITTCPKPCYERYAGNELLATRTRIVRSTEYFDDAVVELSFVNGTWITALHVASG
ncbi:MAG TPA: hypothetical protein VK364_07775, partial [Hymenobacter sp.]|nr:hypothetical protein [Hymenobacter sp.]